jgi:peptidoglycan-N-acetylglucosamine deacetylase
VTASPAFRRFARRLVELSASHTGSVIGVRTREPVVALTFDDGPDPEWTPRVLEVLERHGARGTFFVVGKQAAQYPGLLERMVAAGHALANHTWDHPSLPTLRGRYRRTQLAWCRDVLGARDSRLFRPPYGHQTPASLLDARLLGYRVVLWDAIAEDWLADPPETLVARVERRLTAGSIVLFHDRLATWVDPTHCDRGPTVAAVEQLLERHRGRYRFVTVPELLRHGRPRRWHWFQRPQLDWLHRLT